jgi:hypothetical protein
MDTVKEMMNKFDLFAETPEPGTLEDGLILARIILESGDESTINVTNNRISTAEGIITKALTKLSFDLSWENNLPAEIENCLNSASKLIAFGTSNASDMAALHDKVLRRYNDEKATTFEKELYRVFKKHNKR